MPDTWPLIGRDDERSALRAARGQPRCGGVVLAGPAGTGKTRLAQDARAEAERDGWRTATVGGSPAIRLFPLAAMASIVPSVALGGRDLTALLARAHEAVARRAAGGRLLLVADDAHALDDASAVLLHQLISAEVAFVVATVRTGEPAPDAVTALWKDGLLERIDLAPLDRGEIEQLCAAALGAPLSHAALTVVAERSAGNALYLRELVTSAVDDGSLVRRGGLWHQVRPFAAPPRLVEVLEGTLVDLPSDARELMELLALGEPLPAPDLLERVGRAGVDELEGRGLVRFTEDGRRLYAWLGHPLYGDVLRHRMSTRRRRTLTGELASLLERYGGRRAGDALRLATWRLEAGGPVDPDQLLAGSSAALTRHEYALAGRLAQAAAERSASAADNSAAVAAAITRAADAYCRAGDGAAALACLDSVDDTGLAHEQRRALQLVRLETLIYACADFPAAVALIDAALADPTPGATRDEISFYRHQIALLGGDSAAADEIARLARSARGAFGGMVCGAHSMNLLFRGRFDDSLHYCDQADVALAEATGPVRWSAQGIAVFRGTALTELGRLDDAESTLAETYRICLAGRQTEMQGWLAGTLARLALLRGRVGEAVTWGQQATAPGTGDGRTYFAARAHLDHALALATAGRADDASAALAAAEACGQAGPAFEAQALDARGWAQLAGHDRPNATQSFTESAELARRSGLAGLELTALHSLRRIGRAPSPDQVTALDRRVDGALAAAKIRYLLARSGADLRAAGADFAAVGALLFAAEAFSDAAVGFADEGHARDAAAAGIRARDFAAQCDGARTPALRPPRVRHRLTDTEQRFAELAASGLRSKQIAQAAHVSVRTVDNALQRAYAKLGVRGRTELADVLGDT